MCKLWACYGVFIVYRELDVLVALVKQQTVDGTETGADLLGRYRASGSPEVFGVIMRAYGGMVFSVCFKVTRDASDAEDASQAVFLTLAVQCKTGAVIHYLGPWLKKVAKRTSLDLIRSRKRRTRRESITAQRRPDFVRPNPSAGAEHDELSSVIRAELDHLPAKYRMPLVLHYFGGLSHEQIAIEMRCTTAALGVRLHRARKMLGTRLTDRGVSLEGAALGAAIAVAIQYVVTDRFLNHTHAAASAMAWTTHAPSAIASLPHGLGDIAALVSQIGSSMARARMRMAALAMAASVTMLGGAAEAVRHLPDSIRPSMEFLAPSNILDKLFRSLVPEMRVDAAPVPAEVKSPRTVVAYADSKRTDAIRYEPMVTRIGRISSDNQPVLAMQMPPFPRVVQQVPVPVIPRTSLSYTSGASPVSQTPVANSPTLLSPVAPTVAVKSTDAPSFSSGAIHNGNNASAGADKGDAAPALPPVREPRAKPQPGEIKQWSPDVMRAPDASATSIASASPGFGTSALRQFDASAVGGYELSSTLNRLTSNVGVQGMTLDANNRPIRPDNIVLGSGDAFVPAGSGVTQVDWADSADGIEIGGVNSATFNFTDVPMSGLLSVSRLSLNTTFAPARPGAHRFIGVWSFDAAFSYKELGLTVRYDDALAEAMGLNESILKLWVYDTDRWVRINDSTFRRDLGAHTLHGEYDTAITYFAVSAPEPTGVLALAGCAAVTLLRRRRERC